MSSRISLLNELLDIGGIATLNNLYSPQATSPGGCLLQARKNLAFYLREGLIEQIPTIGKTRNPSHETFYCLTKKGADFIGRPKEYKYKKYGKSPNNIMHESMKFDVARSLLRLYPTCRFTIAYHKSIYKVRPDITVRVENGKHIKYLLIELERKKTVDRVLKEKIMPYEEMFQKMKQKQSHDISQYTILFIYSDIWFNIFARPQEYTLPENASRIGQVNIMLRQLVHKYCRNLPPQRYLFAGFHDFYRLNEPIWLTTSGQRISLTL